MLKPQIEKNLFCIILVTILNLFLAGCNNEAPSASMDEKGETLEDALFLSEIIPLANGAAYLKTNDAIYYVNGNNAVKLDDLPTDLLFPELVALSDGSALLTVGISSGKGLYRLDGVEVVKITEALSVDRESATAPLDDFYFVESSRLRRELKKLDEIYSENPEHK